MLRRIIWLLLALPLVVTIHAQVTLMASNIQDLSGGKLQFGQICLVPLNSNGAPISFRPGSGGTAFPREKCQPIANGAFSVSVPDTALTSPQNVCFSATIILSGSPPLRYPISGCIQPTANNGSWCVSSVCNLDNYSPSNTALPVIQTGPPGPGFTYRGAWLPNHAYLPNDIVSFSGAVYEASAAFTSGASFNATQWNLWVPGSSVAFGNSFIPSTDNAFDLGSASFRVRNLYATGLQLSLPAAGSSIDNYSYFGATYNASTFVQGLILGKSSNNRWGIDWGLGSKGIATRLFAPAGQSIEFCFHAANVTPASPADLQNCPETLMANGIFFNQPVTFGSTNSLALGTGTNPTSLASYPLLLNKNGLTSGGLLGGFNFLVNGVNAWGQDILQESTLGNQFAQRVYFPNTNGAWEVCPYNTNSPTSFVTCPIQVNASGVIFNQPVTFNVPLTFTALPVGPSAPAGMTNYGLNVNPSNTFTGTGLWGGFKFLDASGDQWVMSVGNDPVANANGTGRLGFSTLEPAENGVFANCFYPQAAPPVTQLAAWSNCGWRVTANGLLASFPLKVVGTQEWASDSVVDANRVIDIKGSIGAIHSTTSLLNFPGLINFGDSITCGKGSDGDTVTPTCPVGTGTPGAGAHGYAFMMAPEFRGQWQNWGFGGDEACDTTSKYIFQHSNPTATNNPTVTLMDGVNDANTHLSDTTWNAVYQECMIAALAHLGAPNTSRLAGQSASVTKTGTWTADNTIGTGYGIQSSTAGDTLSFSITITVPATGLYLSSRITDGSTATASVSIDGAVVGTLYGSAGATGGITMATSNGTTTAIGGVRFPITSGTHTVLITNTSPAGQAFTFQEASWFSKPQSPGPPRILVGGVTHINTISADPYTAVYDGFIRAITTQFWNDGFYTQYVDTRAYLNTSTDYTNGDPLHPNDIGHLHLRDAFLGAAGGYGAFAPLNQTWTTTTSTAETVVISGVSSTSVCMPSPGNASAATGGAWIPAPTTPGQITLNHAATAGMIYNISCTP